MSQIRFVSYLIFHPFDGFWEMKFEHKGRKRTVAVLFLAYFLVLILDRQFRAFLFNMQYNTPIDLVYQLELMIPFALFAVSNWSITTLTDGKGNMKDILCVLSYPLTVLMLFRIVVMLLSHYLSLTESVYLTVLDVIGIGIYLLLVFIGLSVIHQYSFVKTIGTLFLTAAAAAVIVFICMLFYSLLQEIVGFAYSIYREMSLRL